MYLFPESPTVSKMQVPENIPWYVKEVNFPPHILKTLHMITERENRITSAARFPSHVGMIGNDNSFFRFYHSLNFQYLILLMFIGHEFLNWNSPIPIKLEHTKQRWGEDHYFVNTCGMIQTGLF